MHFDLIRVSMNLIVIIHYLPPFYYFLSSIINYLVVTSFNLHLIIYLLISLMHIPTFHFILLLICFFSHFRYCECVQY